MPATTTTRTGGNRVEGWQPSPDEGTEVEFDLVDLPFRFGVTAATPHKAEFDDAGAGFQGLQQHPHLFQPSPISPTTGTFPNFSRRSSSSYFVPNEKTTPTPGLFLTPPTSRHASPASTCSVSSTTSTGSSGGAPGSGGPLSSTERRAIRQRARDPNYVPRPPNPFILFRIKFVEEHRGLSQTSSPSDSLSPSDSSNKSLSHLAGQKWKELSEEEKDVWKKQAEVVRKEHEKMYPGYRYRPTRRSRDGGRGGSVMMERVRDLGLSSARRASPTDRMVAFTEAQRNHRRTSSVGNADDLALSGAHRHYQPRRSCPSLYGNDDQGEEEHEGLFMLSPERPTGRFADSMLLPPAVIDTRRPSSSTQVRDHDYSNRAVSPATSNDASDIFKDLDDMNIVSLTSFRSPYTPTPTPWRVQGQQGQDLRNAQAFEFRQNQNQVQLAAQTQNIRAISPNNQSLPFTFSSNGIYYTQVDVPPQPESISVEIPTFDQIQSYNGQLATPASAITSTSAATSGSGPVSSLSELTAEHMRALTGMTAGLGLASPAPSPLSTNVAMQEGASPISAPAMTPQSSTGTADNYDYSVVGSTGDAFGMGFGYGMDMNMAPYGMSPSPSMSPASEPMFFNFEACEDMGLGMNTNGKSGDGQGNANMNVSSGQFSITPIDFENCGFDERLFSSFDFDFESDVVDVEGQHTRRVHNDNDNDVEDEDATSSSTETVVPSSSPSSSRSSSTVTTNTGMAMMGNMPGFHATSRNGNASGDISTSSLKAMDLDLGLESDLDITMINFFDSLHQE